uniref:Uncharacterized protein n=1 Tax=Panagrolaimus sp. PS1159 TaxID=55785 RepID=A0AC35F6G8_9BILA
MIVASIISILSLAAIVTGFGYNDCSAYNNLEAQVNCGPNGYLMNYGIVYCHRFFTPAYYNQFDTAGKAFVDCTGQCLVNKATTINRKAFFNVIQSDAFTDDRLLAEAFQTIGKCGFKCLI